MEVYSTTSQKVSNFLLRYLLVPEIIFKGHLMFPSNSKAEKSPYDLDNVSVTLNPTNKKLWNLLLEEAIELADLKFVVLLKKLACA
jgi:hypothetical protein